MELWITGRFYDNLIGNGRYSDGDPHTIWGFGGVFSSRELAIKACELENDFVYKTTLDNNLMPITGMVEVEYPLADENNVE